MSLTFKLTTGHLGSFIGMRRAREVGYILGAGGVMVLSGMMTMRRITLNRPVYRVSKQES